MYCSIAIRMGIPVHVLLKEEPEVIETYLILFEEEAKASKR